MTDFEKLLNMIENVDTADSDALDEIDEMVFKYLGDKYGNLWITVVGESIAYSIAKYTRSRDALKGMRPKGWRCFVAQQDDEKGTWVAGFQKQDYSFHAVLTEGFKTEEFAELHAILQAIEWERTNV